MEWSAVPHCQPAAARPAVEPARLRWATGGHVNDDAAPGRVRGGMIERKLEAGRRRCERMRSDTADNRLLAVSGWQTSAMQGQVHRQEGGVGSGIVCRVKKSTVDARRVRGEEWSVSGVDSEAVRQ